jgi:integrase
MPLTDISVRQAKARMRPYKISDGGGLMLLIQPNGAKWWRMRYRFEGREKMLSLGLYPDVPLAMARERHADARRLLTEGLDPSLVRKRDRAGTDCRFSVVAQEWLEKHKGPMSPATYRKARWILEDLVLPKIGERPISRLTARDVLDVLESIDDQGHHETAKRMRQRIGQVFRYAVATSRADRDITIDLRGALRPAKVTHRAAIVQPGRVQELLRAIWGYAGQPSTAAALKLAPLVFVRPGELRAAEWSEFDFPNAMWRIPAHRMKMREEHLVPLSRQAIDILKELQSLTGDGRFVFPAIGYAERPISDNTINAALRRMGYEKSEMSAHGFRTMASTMLNELGWAPELIELQLAHKDRNKVRDAYNRAARLGERAKMMQAWADYLDGIRQNQQAARLTLVA